MEEISALIQEFEERNDFNISVTLYGDGSGNVNEFWDNEFIKEFQSNDELEEFLKTHNYKK